MTDSSTRAKLLLLIPHLGGGGAEHIAAILAQSLSPKKYEIHLGLVTQSTPEENDLPPRVTVHALGASKVRKSAWKILRLVWRIRPAVILSGMAHLNLLVLMLRPLYPPEHAFSCVRTGLSPHRFLPQEIHGSCGVCMPPDTGTQIESFARHGPWHRKSEVSSELTARD
ncbi:MAG: hypothetical protein WB561_01415 [Terracidiphilus sp.]